MGQEDSSLNDSFLQMPQTVSLVHRSKTLQITTSLLNIVYSIAAITMLYATRSEHPNTPIRLWISVNCVLSLIHLTLVLRFPGVGVAVSLLASTVWWIVGSYWVISGGDVLKLNAPNLYGTTVFYLAIPVIVIVFSCIVIPSLLCCFATVAEICGGELVTPTRIYKYPFISTRV